MEDGERVGDDHPRERGRSQSLHGRIREHRVGGHGPDLLGPVALEQGGGGADGSSRVDHVVDDHAVTALDLTHDVEGLYRVHRATWSGLVDQRQVCAEVLRIALRHLHATGVWGNDHDVPADVGSQVVLEDRCRSEVVERDVEEPLDLSRVQVDRDDPVRPGCLEHVGDQLGRDRFTPGGLAILSGVAVVGDDGRDALG